MLAVPCVRTDTTTLATALALPYACFRTPSPVVVRPITFCARWRVRANARCRRGAAYLLTPARRRTARWYLGFAFTTFHIQVVRATRWEKYGVRIATCTRFLPPHRKRHCTRFTFARIAGCLRLPSILGWRPTLRFVARHYCILHFTTDLGRKSAHSPRTSPTFFVRVIPSLPLPGHSHCSQRLRTRAR